MRHPKIYLGQPSYGSVHPMTQMSVVNATGSIPMVFKPMSFSLLAFVFNALWCRALNMRKKGVTHFAMLHADIEAEPGWLEKLFWELERHQADVVSAVVPIKDDRGVTSTAIPRDPDDEWRNEKRFTMKEIMKLPETFTAADAGYPGRALLVNTGCWIARLDRPWCDDYQNVYFTIRDRIVKIGDEYHADTLPEDWNFSRMLHRAGCKVMATRKVKVIHHGNKGYPNDKEWGTLDVDQFDERDFII